MEITPGRRLLRPRSDAGEVVTFDPVNPLDSKNSVFTPQVKCAPRNTRGQSATYSFEIFVIMHTD